MFNYYKNKLLAYQQSKISSTTSPSPLETKALSLNLKDNLDTLKQLYHNSSDLVIKQLTVNGQELAIISIESMINFQLATDMFLEPLMDYVNKNQDPNDLFTYMSDNITLGTNIIQIEKYEDVFQNIMSGSAVILLNNYPSGLAFNAVGYAYRSVGEPSGEVNLRGSREGFTEVIRLNMTMIRRRLKTPDLKFELMKCGTKSKTDICIMYMNDKVNHQFVAQIKEKLRQIKLDDILDSGYIQPFLEGKPFSIFSDVGTTERPDTMCAKLSEGRIGILVDGTPFALITPYFFTDNFQNFDDYCNRPYFVFPNRLLKYIAFFITILLPGTYVALGNFHLEMFPHALLYTIATSQETTAFPLLYQAIIIAFIYEIMSEAGLRLQRPIGSAVSIIGALVIGDAAVSAGLIGSPMVMIIALTAITAFVVPTLHQPLIILRFGFIILGGTLGLFGIILGCCALLLNICALENNGYLYSSPLSPLDPNALKDVILKVSWKYMNKKTDSINDDQDKKG
ncbi:MAG TPA: spore germination protein [Firmicutes bacterium]|nr:spore germination protein [Bacillota bacterium]